MVAAQLGRHELLLALRLAGVADTDALSARLETAPDVVEAALRDLEGDQLVRHGRGEQWALTPTGRREGESLLRGVLAEAHVEAHLGATYEAFLVLNPRLLELCTDWQLRSVGGTLVPNDHSDTAHDAAVLVALEDLHRAAETVLRGLDGVPTFDSYARRFANALARVQAGEVDYLVKPTVDSYHQVWFELHEHLLAALGLDRSEEAQRIAAAADHEERES